MEDYEMLIELVDDALRRDYGLYIMRPYGGDKVVSVLIKKTKNGDVASVRQINFNGYINNYSYIFDVLKDEDFTCVVKYDKEEWKYKASIQRTVIKGLFGVDEYTDVVDECVVYEKKPFHALNVLEITLGDKYELSINDNDEKNKVKKRNFNKC